MKPQADLYISGAREVITCEPGEGDLLGRIPGGAVAIRGSRILSVGSPRKVAAEVDLSAARTLPAEGRIVAPGFVDCHTHLVFGGSRGREYALKMTRTTAEIERSGLTCGIPASIAMTREAGEEELLTAALDRLGRMLAHGTTTVESKSGYGIRAEAEFRQLRVNRRLGELQPVTVVSTFLGAHDFPPEIDRDDPGKRRAYIRQLTEEMIPRAAGEKLAEFCDIYCDTGYYTREEAGEILSCGRAHGLAPKIHTDAYANVGGSGLDGGSRCRDRPGLAVPFHQP